MLPQRLQRGRHRGAAPAGVQPHRREPVLAGPLHRAHRAAGAPGARHAAAHRHRRATRRRPVREALSDAGACAAGWRPGRADAERSRRTCSSARCWRRAGRPGTAAAASPTTWRALERAAQALRERLSTEQWGAGALDGRGLRAGAARPTPGRAAGAGAGAAGAGPAGAAAGGRHRRADRPHDARPRLAAAHRGPAAGAADRPGHRPGRLRAGAARWASAAGIELLLELFDSVITFRARYQRHEDLLALTDLLVLDSANPRALAGVLRRLRTELRKLPGRRGHAARCCWRCCRPKAPACTLEIAARCRRRRHRAARAGRCRQRLADAAAALADAHRPALLHARPRRRTQRL